MKDTRLEIFAYFFCLFFWLLQFIIVIFVHNQNKNNMDLILFFASIPALLGFGYVCYRIDQDNKRCYRIRQNFKKQFEND